MFSDLDFVTPLIVTCEYVTNGNSNSKKRNALIELF